MTMKFVFLIGMLLYCISNTFAANPAIIFGSGGKALTIPTNGIQLSSGVVWYDLPADPTITATDSPQGSFGAFGANLYVKQDAGSTTNWNIVATGVTPITTEGDFIVGNNLGVGVRLPIGVSGKFLKSDGTTASWGDVDGLTPLMSKGSLFSSNGVVNGEQTACADGESLEYDAATPTGLKCVVGGVALLAKGSLLGSDGATNLEFTLCGDGEILEYDAAEALGFKCVVKPLELALLSKGSIVTSNGTVNGEQTACADGQVLEYDASTPTGIKCAVPATATSLTTKGDLQTFDTANQRLAVGTDGQNLVADSTEPTGIKWIDELILGLGVLGKGSILTSDGVDNGEFTACANDEILVWDSAEAAGIKCEAKPVASAGPTKYTGNNITSTIALTVSYVTHSTIPSILVTSGQKIQVYTETNNSLCTGRIEHRLLRNGVEVATQSRLDLGASNYEPCIIMFVDSPPAGATVYTWQAKSSNSTGFMNRTRISALAF